MPIASTCRLSIGCRRASGGRNGCRVYRKDSCCHSYIADISYAGQPIARQQYNKLLPVHLTFCGIEPFVFGKGSTATAFTKPATQSEQWARSSSPARKNAKKQCEQGQRSQVRKLHHFSFFLPSALSLHSLSGSGQPVYLQITSLLKKVKGKTKRGPKENSLKLGSPRSRGRMGWRSRQFFCSSLTCAEHSPARSIVLVAAEVKKGKEMCIVMARSPNLSASYKSATLFRYARIQWLGKRVKTDKMEEDQAEGWTCTRARGSHTVVRFPFYR